MVLSKAEIRVLCVATRGFQAMNNQSADPLDMEAYKLSKNIDAFMAKLTASNQVKLSSGEVENCIIFLECFLEYAPKDKLAGACSSLIAKLTPHRLQL